MTMWSFLISEFAPWLIGGAVTLLGIGFAYLKGRSTGKKLERAKQTEGQLKLREAYDETNARPVDHGTAFGELFKRARKR